MRLQVVDVSGSPTCFWAAVDQVDSMQFTCPCPATVELQDACGLPLGLVAQPLAAPNGGGGGIPTPSCWAADLARCGCCLAYINPLCEVDDEGWGCALCGSANDFSTATTMRRYYAAGVERRGALPELLQPALDAACPLVAADPDEGIEEVEAVKAAPAVLALMDTCWEEEGALEAVKSALSAALEALPPAGRFGLVSFGSQIVLHQVAAGGSASGLVLHEPAAEAGESPVESVVPLGSVLVPVGPCKAAMLATIEGLEAEPPVGGGRERALGDTLRTVLRWVATGAAVAAAERPLVQAAAQAAPQKQRAGRAASESEEEQQQNQLVGALPSAQGFPGLRLLLFLSGPPNVGAGAVVVRKAPAPDPAAAVKAAQAVAEEAAKDFAGLMLDPAYPELSAWGDSTAASVERTSAAAVSAAAHAALPATAADLSHAAPPGVPGGDLVVNLAAREFYEEAGAAAAALGISIDIFAACPRWIGLDLLEPLATASGGGVLLYNSLEAAPLPQDVYKCVTQPRAFACILRLRCSPELALTGYHGRLTADREPGLFRLVACGFEDAFAFDLDRTKRRASGAAPAVQLVLQYSMLLPAEAAAGGEEQAGAVRFVLRRRMRIITAAVPLASTLHQLYEHCDAEATACLVVHKSLEAAASRGMPAARQMLLDWLVLLVARVADPDAVLYKRRPLRRGEMPPPPPKVDASLSQVEALQQLPHVVYALLRGPLLQPMPAAPSLTAAPATVDAHWHAHPEAAVAMRSLLSVLPPDEATVAVCPQLSSWSSPDAVAVWHHSLSATALAVEQQPIWVLDTFSRLICLYTPDTRSGLVGGPPPPPFPPPAASLLRHTLAGIRQVRRSTPELLLLCQGVDDTSQFFDQLWEDAPTVAPATLAAPFSAGNGAVTHVPAQQSFVSFLDVVAAQAQEVLLADE